MTYEAIDLVRTNCGGSGYSAHSLLPQIFSDYSPVPTYEGDNTVMAQQCFSYLSKKIKKIEQGTPATKPFDYLNNIEQLCSARSTATSIDEFLDLDHLETAVAVRAAFRVRGLFKKWSASSAKKVTKLNDLFPQDLI